MRTPSWLLVLAAMAVATPAAADLPLAPYRPLYPGLYLDLGLEQDPGDESFDASSRRISSALPSLQGDSRLPSLAADVRLGWTFPLFEQDRLPFLSERLHLARLHLRYVDASARGAVTQVVAQREDLQNPSSGVGDVTLEVGSFLSGSRHWREGRTGPLSSLLLLGLRLPTGTHDADAPANSGSNHVAVHAHLGLHGQPWNGALLDGGVGYRHHFVNHEPQFERLAPSRQGDEWRWDLQLSQRLAPGWHLSLGLDGHEGAANRYRDPGLLIDAPLTVRPLTDTVARPGRYHDDGTSLRTAHLALRHFLTPHLALALHWAHPLRGESGEFDLDLISRFPAGCNLDSPLCAVTPAGTRRTDGYGSARSLAADRVGLSLTWQFGPRETRP